MKESILLNGFIFHKIHIHIQGVSEEIRNILGFDKGLLLEQQNPYYIYFGAFLVCLSLWVLYFYKVFYFQITNCKILKLRT